MHLTENRLGRNEILCADDNHSYMCHICAKGILDSNLGGYAHFNMYIFSLLTD